MAISGGIKFFNQNSFLSSAGGSVVASSGAVTQNNCIDKNPLSYWRSVGSSDAVTETLTITFPSTTISRVALLDHNFKGFNVQYWNGAAFVHFSGVLGLDGAKVNVTETIFSKDTAYYEVTPVVTTQLRVQVTQTQVANAEKFLSQAIGTTELGTLAGYPDIKSATHSRNERKKEMLSGKFLVIKGIESFETSLGFDNYPPSLSADLDLMVSLFERETPFLIWLCGGRYGSAYFRYTLRGYRLKDMFVVQITGDFKMEYRNNTYVTPVSFEVPLKEHV